MSFTTFQTEHFLSDHSIEVTDMAFAASGDLSVAELGIGALSMGSATYPPVVLMNVQEELASADIFIGHIGDRMKAGESPLFNPSTAVLLAAAMELVSCLDAMDAEKHLLLVELTGHCASMEDTTDAKAIVEAVSTIATSLCEKMTNYGLYEDGKLNYGVGRMSNGQIELVRKMIDDPNHRFFNFAAGGFVNPSWVTDSAR